MLPKFPKFKKLELRDRKDVESHTLRFDPYSDFNFHTLWSWDIHNAVRISELNNNLVLELNDYKSDKAYLTFLGDNKVNLTVEKLISYQEEHGILNRRLRFVPEVSIQGLDQHKFSTGADADNNDYIYDLGALSKYSSPEYRKKRAEANGFERRYKDVVVKKIDLSVLSIQSQIIALANFWLVKKSASKADQVMAKELLALGRFFVGDFKDAIGIGVFTDSNLIAFTIVSPHANYLISHFTMADISYKRINEFFMREMSKIFVKDGYNFMNFQEDMGLETLRVSKTSYYPIKFLRKYFINRAS